MSAGPNAAEPVPVVQILPPRDIGRFSDDKEKDKDKAAELKKLCCEDIDIPPDLHGILKDFTKGAITTQPRDLLHWSAAYFRSKCKGEIPPVKDRLEYPVIEGPNGLTKGLLRVLHKQLGGQAQGDSGALAEKWTAICLNVDDMKKLLQENGLPEVGFNWTHFVVAAAASLKQGGLRDVMEVVCFVMAPDVSHGVTVTMRIDKFLEAYVFIGPKFGVTKETMDVASNWLVAKAQGQGNLIGPADLSDPQCPPLNGTH